jgi:hypothetical protein
MKHILNNMSEEEKNAIREQHTGGMKVMTENFNKLINSKLGDSKPLVSEQPSGLNTDKGFNTNLFKNNTNDKGFNTNLFKDKTNDKGFEDNFPFIKMGLSSTNPKIIKMNDGDMSLNWGSCKEAGHDWCISIVKKGKFIKVFGDNKNKIQMIKSVFEKNGFKTKNGTDYMYDDNSTEKVTSTLKTVLSKLT